MKKIIALALSVVMLLSLTTVLASAAETTLIEIEDAKYFANGTETDVDVYLYDTDTGNNKTSNCQKGVLPSSLFTKTTEGDVHGETVSTKTYSTPVSSGSELPYQILNLTTGEKLEYLYNLKVTLQTAADINEIKFYMHGYKPGILDRQFTILVSSDGETWKKVFSAGDTESLVDETTGLLTAEGLEVYSGAINTPGATASDTDPATCVTVSFEKIENVKYVMWACSKTRFNNSHYTARFTEVEVYGTPVAGAETTAAETTKAAEETTKAAEETTKAAEETTKAAEETTKAADETTKAAETSGCGSSVAAISVAVVAVLGCAVIRKKH